VNEEDILTSQQRCNQPVAVLWQEVSLAKDWNWVVGEELTYDAYVSIYMLKPAIYVKASCHIIHQYVAVYISATDSS
jgi:hypothetical protein